MELRQINLVLCLARHRHFGRAARELGVSQPALSKGLQQLEESLGVQLFTRSASEVTPTPFGEAIVRRGAGILADAAEIEHELDALRGIERGELRFGVGPAYSADPVGPALGEFMKKHPGIDVQPLTASYDELLRRLRLAEIDLYVATHPGDDEPGLEIRPIAERRPIYCCRPGHPLARRDDLEVPDVLQFDLLTLPILPYGRRALAREIGKLRDSPRKKTPTIETSDMALVRAALLRSDAIAIAVRAPFHADLAAGALVTLRVADPEQGMLPRPGAIVHLTNRPLTPAAASFAAMIADEDAASKRANPDWFRD